MGTVINFADERLKRGLDANLSDVSTGVVHTVGKISFTIEEYRPKRSWRDYPSGFKKFDPDEWCRLRDLENNQD